ncbi:MAG: ATP-binding protein, partial [Treponema sp.]|nr:ATP-binding protein [Treponema sp.]
FLTSSRITQRARFLQQDLERATTMQDSMKYGLFLMDQKYIIQGAYSKALEKILDVSNLEGKSFLEILASSVKSNEQSGLADYFEMIFKRSFDKDMLESINPIESLTYISVETGKIKNIRTNFALTEWGRGFSYILGTLEDITSEKALENQLLEAESQKEKEMQSLFQVIQLDPIVLGDFIDDAEYEFNQINAMLKNKKNYTQEVLIGMYQSIHAIKSNALILNLDNFAGKLQKLEGSIKALQEKGANSVTFDDFLSLILEENDVLKEKDQLKTAIMKIVSFKNLSGKYSIQQHYVLVETLTQVCKKAQDALNKDVRCVLEEIDDSALEYGPRRVIKEVLTQLVRNAVYHGIETPEERIAAGKDAQGVVRLSLRLMDKDIIINLSDDGRGLDFDLIKLKILEKKLLSEEEANDRSNLLKMIFRPGFTTQENADMHAGRGIGLSLVKDRIRKLNGKIKVNSVFGKGTTFTITIPLEQNQGASDASQDA